MSPMRYGNGNIEITGTQLIRSGGRPETPWWTSHANDCKGDDPEARCTCGLDWYLTR